MWTSKSKKSPEITDTPKNLQREIVGSVFSHLLISEIAGMWPARLNDITGKGSKGGMNWQHFLANLGDKFLSKEKIKKLRLSR